MSDVAQVMRDLEDAARGLDAASTKLSRLSLEFDGLDLRWQDALLDAIDAIYADLEQSGGRVPAQGIVERRAARRAKEHQPDLHAEWSRVRSEMAALKSWIAAKKDVISARQSVLSAEKVLIQPIGRA